MHRSLSGGRNGSASRGAARRPNAAPARRRAIRLEQLEDRSLLALLPYGALPDDTGEYMLGDVYVSVVLMESNANSTDYLPVAQGGLGAPQENWTAASIATVKSNIQTGVQWWEQTLDQLPNVPNGLLHFTFDWTYADAPVATNVEPIARPSDDFAQNSTSFQKGWVFDFFKKVGFDLPGNDFSKDVKAWNDFQRQQHGTDWAFTIFVVNSANDPAGNPVTDICPDAGMFASGGSFCKAFSYAGGQFMVVPSTRPASTFAHETGHQFWALDEYAGAGNYTDQRGYYNTQNYNAVNNPVFTAQNLPAKSIMSKGDVAGQSLPDAYNAHTSSQSSLEMIGWKDSDADGIFDVLDVPFTLTGSGRYDSAAGRYRFTGTTSVNTLPNQNPSGLQDDITINQIRVIQASIDDQPWATVQTLPARTYQANLNFSFPVSAGDHTIKIRSVDTRTGVMSPEFVGTTTGPTSMPTPGIGGFVFTDDNGNGVWDANEQPISDFALNLVDQDNVPVTLQHVVEPDDWEPDTVLNNVDPLATVKAIGSDIVNQPNGNVIAYGDPDTNKVFGNYSVFNTGVNEVQNVMLFGTSGTYTLAFMNQQTASIAGTATAADIRQALEDLSNIAPGDVSVVGSGSGPFTVTFGGAYATTNVPAMVATGTGLTAAVLTLKDGRAVVDGGRAKTWTASSRQLKVDFSAPVGLVSLNAYSGSTTGGTSYARLEAYNSQGVLLGRYTSGPISGAGFATLIISRPTADIAYVIAHGHATTDVKFDTLKWGPSSSATTNTFGAYSLAFLPAGTYRVQATPPAGHVITTPAGEVATINVAAGQSVGNVNFGIFLPSNKWHNYASPLLVTGGSGNPSPTDALIVINWLNAHASSGALPDDLDPAVFGYLDVDNDLTCTPTDALLIINWLNSQTPGVPNGEGEGTTGALVAAADTNWHYGGSSASQGEGEGGDQTPPLTAEEYLARNPIHFQNIPGSDVPCTCAQCQAARGEISSPTVAAPKNDGLSLLTTMEDAAPGDVALPLQSSQTHSTSPAAGNPNRPALSFPIARKSTDWTTVRRTPPGEEMLDLLAADVAQVWQGKRVTGQRQSASG